MSKFFGIYSDSSELEQAYQNGDIINPYVALVSGALDYNTMEPEPVDPCAGYGSPEECECVQQGGSWDGSECVMPSDDPCDGDPECECNEGSGYNWWEEGTCHSCEEEWESLGYSSPEECACAKRGEDSGVCPEPDPCEGYESPEECECAQQGGTWTGSECQ